MTKKLIFAFLLTFAFNFNADAQKLTGDPWIFQMYKELYNRQPSAWELNIKNYNLGSWNNYGELKTYVQQYQNSMTSKKLTVTVKSIDNKKSAAIFHQNGVPAAGSFINNDSGSLIGNDGAGLIGNDAAGLIGIDAATLIGIDAATLKNLPGVSFGIVGTRYLGSSGIKVIPTSGRGTLVIKSN